MIYVYKEFEINVEIIAEGPSARAQLLKAGEAVPYATLDNALWVYGADKNAALTLAQYFVDGLLPHHLSKNICHQKEVKLTTFVGQNCLSPSRMSNRTNPINSWYERDI